MANDESTRKEWAVTDVQGSKSLVEAESVSVDDGVLWLVDGVSGTLEIKGVFATGQWLSAVVA